jgi:hypothetical protein
MNTVARMDFPLCGSRDDEAPLVAFSGGMVGMLGDPVGLTRQSWIRSAVATAIVTAAAR